MLIGIPKETKPFEYRVALTPYGVRQLVRQGHQVIVQRGAGDEAGFRDSEYQQAGAVIASLPGEIYERAEMIVSKATAMQFESISAAATRGQAAKCRYEKRI